MFHIIRSLSPKVRSAANAAYDASQRYVRAGRPRALIVSSPILENIKRRFSLDDAEAKGLFQKQGVTVYLSKDLLPSEWHIIPGNQAVSFMRSLSRR